MFADCNLLLNLFNFVNKQNLKQCLYKYNNQEFFFEVLNNSITKRIYKISTQHR